MIHHIYDPETKEYLRSVEGDRPDNSTTRPLPKNVTDGYKVYFENGNFIMRGKPVNQPVEEVRPTPEEAAWAETRSLIIKDLRATDWVSVNTVAECKAILIKLVELL